MPSFSGMGYFSDSGSSTTLTPSQPSSSLRTSSGLMGSSKKRRLVVPR